jgi:hypothetical protein
MERLKEILIEGADYQYYASTEGNIYRWNGKNFRELLGWDHHYKRWDHHYRRYSLKVNGQKKQMYGQRLVLLAFEGPPPNEDDVARHGPNGSLDNRPCQLRWGTHAENMNEDRKRDGNYFNRGRKKKECTAPKPEKWDLDPDDEEFWNKAAENNRNGYVEDCPF